MSCYPVNESAELWREILLSCSGGSANTELTCKGAEVSPHFGALLLSSWGLICWLPCREAPYTPIWWHFYQRRKRKSHWGRKGRSDKCPVGPHHGAKMAFFFFQSEHFSSFKSYFYLTSAVRVFSWKSCDNVGTLCFRTGFTKSRFRLHCP